MQIKNIAILFACAAVTFTEAVLADPSTKKYSFEIARQPITTTLREFSRQTGFDVSFVAKDDGQQNLLIGPLRGKYTVESALKELLADTALTFTRVNDVTIAVIARRGDRVGGMSGTLKDSSMLRQLADRQFADEAAGRVEPNRVAELSSAENSLEPRRGASESARGKTMEEVVVTAQKREQRFQDVPTSIQVLASDTLEAQGLTRLSDYSKQVPGLRLIGATGPGQGKAVLRGISTGTDRNPLVGVYLDDVPFTPSGARTFAQDYAFDPSLADIEHIEVLKGPQSTLYGASAMGGIIKFVSKKPDPTQFESTARVEGSQVDHGGTGHNARISANIPIADNVAARVSVFHRRDPGYVDDRFRGQEDVNSVDVKGARASVLVKLTDNLETTFSGLWQEIDSNGPYAVPIDRTTLRPSLGGISVSSPISERYGVESQAVSNVTSLTMGLAELTNIFSYARLAPTSLVDFSSVAGFFAAPAGTGVHVSSDIWSGRTSDEIRLTSRPGKLEWMLGGFYTDQEDRYYANYRGTDSNGSVLPESSAFFNYYTYVNRSAYEEWAGFANMTYHFLEQVEATLGIRYSSNEQNFTVVSTGLLGTNSVGQPTKDSATSYLGTVSYKPNSDLTFYVRAASAYRPGGANFLTVTQRTFNPPTGFDSDELWNYEAGVKGTVWDDKLAFSAAVYHMDWTDIQINVTLANFSITGNAAEAKSDGVEVSFGISPVVGLYIGVSGAYNDARIDADAPSIFARRNDPLPYSPKWSGSVVVDYRKIVLNDVSAFGGLTYAYVDKQWGVFQRTGQVGLPSYSTLDARTGIEWGKYTFTARVDNVTNRYAVTQITTSSAAGSPLVGIVLRPRTFILAVDARF